jgi:hypothetical protein
MAARIVQERDPACADLFRGLPQMWGVSRIRDYRAARTARSLQSPLKLLRRCAIGCRSNPHLVEFAAAARDGRHRRLEAFHPYVQSQPLCILAAGEHAQLHRPTPGRTARRGLRSRRRVCSRRCRMSLRGLLQRGRASWLRGLRSGCGWWRSRFLRRGGGLHRALCGRRCFARSRRLCAGLRPCVGCLRCTGRLRLRRLRTRIRRLRCARLFSLRLRCVRCGRAGLHG